MTIIPSRPAAHTTQLIVTLSIGLLFAIPNHAHAQQAVTEPLLEAPMHKIPKGLSFQDYQDANRRVGMGVLYGVIPGGVHRYAQEKTTGLVLGISGLAGITAIVVGASLTTKVTPKNDKYETTEIGDNAFYKVPTERTGDAAGSTVYRLEELEDTKTELSTTGKTLLGVGIGLLASTYIYDIFYGIKVIEKKRDKARYKIGQMLNKTAQKEPAKAQKPVVRLTPMLDPNRLAGGLQVQLQF